MRIADNKLEFLFRGIAEKAPIWATEGKGEVAMEKEIKVKFPGPYRFSEVRNSRCNHNTEALQSLKSFEQAVNYRRSWNSKDPALIPEFKFIWRQLATVLSFYASQHLAHDQANLAKIRACDSNRFLQIKFDTVTLDCI